MFADAAVFTPTQKDTEVRRLAITLALIAVSGCAGRSPNIPTVAYDTDTIQSCQSLEREVKNNATAAQSKIAANNARDGGDVAIGIGSVILLPLGLLALDLRNADGHEGNALLDRNDRLKDIAISKGCDVSGYPQIARYE